MSHYDSCRDPDQAYKDKMKFKPSKATKKYMKQTLKNKTAILTKPRKSIKKKQKYSPQKHLKEHRLAVEKECLKFIKEKLDTIYKTADQMLLHFWPEELADVILKREHKED